MSTKPIIEITTKRVYGEIKIYPSCAVAQIFAQIAGTKTLSAAVMAQIESLGYNVVDVTVSDWRAAA